MEADSGPKANIKALQHMLGHESAGLMLDRYGHLWAKAKYCLSWAFKLWSLGDSNP